MNVHDLHEYLQVAIELTLIAALLVSGGSLCVFSWFLVSLSDVSIEVDKVSR